MGFFDKVKDLVTSPGGVGAILPNIATGGVGAYLQYRGNRDEQKRANQMAQDQRDWEERMSNTSWQRGVQDMRAAGLNPALAYSQGGASSPSAGIGESVNPMEGVISSAKESAMIAAEVTEIKSRINANNAAAKKDNTTAKTVEKGWPTIDLINTTPSIS